MVECLVMHGAIEPSARLVYFLELCVKFHERFLDYVFGHTEFTDPPQGVAQKGRFQSRKKLLYRFPSGRLRAGFVWLHYGHAGRISMIALGSFHRPGFLVV